MAHMDVVEARREDWSRDPFKLGEEDGYFYGRGTLDDKQGVVAITTALLRLRAEGFQPSRDIIVLFTGDEETSGNGAELAANQWLDTVDARLRAQRRRRRRRLPEDGRCSASASRPPRRPTRASPSPRPIRAATARGRAPTTRSTRSPTRSSGSSGIASSRC